MEIDLDGTEDFLLLACDGLWDVMNEAKVKEFIGEWRSTNADSVEGSSIPRIYVAQHHHLPVHMNVHYMSLVVPDTPKGNQWQ